MKNSSKIPKLKYRLLLLLVVFLIMIIYSYINTRSSNGVKSFVYLSVEDVNSKFSAINVCNTPYVSGVDFGKYYSMISYDCQNDYSVRCVKINKMINVNVLKLKNYVDKNKHYTWYLNCGTKYAEINVADRAEKVNNISIDVLNNNVKSEVIMNKLNTVRYIKYGNKIGIRFFDNGYGLTVEPKENGLCSVAILSKSNQTYIVVISSKLNVDHEYIINNIFK